MKKNRLLAALAVALLLVVSLVVPVSAHHNTYQASVNCALDWSARADYVGGSEVRLVLVSAVKVNGVNFSPSWSDAPTGSGGNPPKTSGFVARSSYLGSTSGLPAATASDFLWVGVSNGFYIFNRSGVGTFTNAAGSWMGTVKLFSWSSVQNKWVEDDSDAVAAPVKPANCPTATATNTPLPPTPTPTDTATNTPLPPTPTPTATATPKGEVTEPATFTPTPTLVPPTATATATPTKAPTGLDPVEEPGAPQGLPEGAFLLFMPQASR